MIPIDIESSRSKLAESDFVELTRLDRSVVGLFKAPAESWIWECHPQGDELLQLLDGEMEITLIREGAHETSKLQAGEIFLVPRGVWHRPYAVTESTILFVTPERSFTSTSDNPTGGAFDEQHL